MCPIRFKVSSYYVSKLVTFLAHADTRAAYLFPGCDASSARALNVAAKMRLLAVDTG